MHVNCGTYVGRYRLAHDYVFVVLNVVQKIQLTLTRGSRSDGAQGREKFI